MDYADYKRLHSQYMANNTGSTVFDSGLLLTSIPIGTYISFAVASVVPHILHPVAEFVIVIMPIILGVTVLSGNVSFIPLQFTLTGLLLFLRNFRKHKKRLNLVLNEPLPARKAFITNYRASTNIVSVICILAVDFMVFPRKFAKTENYGFGLMDLGVGFFVCCNGLVAKHLDKFESIWDSVKKSLPLLCLGLLRLATTKTIDYNEHVSEYGTHWNFFFTLAFCKIVTSIVLFLTRCRNAVVLAVGTAIAHELFLEIGFKRWVFSKAVRTSLLDANRQGLTSILGYVSLYFASIAVGQLTNTSAKTTRVVLMKKLFLVNIILWCLCWFSYNVVGVSRQLANVGYTSWVIALSITKLIQFIIAETLIIVTFENGKIETFEPCVPKMFSAINTNGLFYFLIGNLLTGAVNLTFQTLLLNTTASLLILVTYNIVLCSITYIMYKKKIVIL